MTPLKVELSMEVFSAKVTRETIRTCLIGEHCYARNMIFKDFNCWKVLINYTILLWILNLIFARTIYNTQDVLIRFYFRFPSSSVFINNYLCKVILPQFQSLREEYIFSYLCTLNPCVICYNKQETS